MADVGNATLSGIDILTTTVTILTTSGADGDFQLQPELHAPHPPNIIIFLAEYNDSHIIAADDKTDVKLIDMVEKRISTLHRSQSLYQVLF